MTASERSIENFVMEKYDGSWPTSVMSVPCSVVTMATACFPAMISRASQAQVAWGMA